MVHRIHRPDGRLQHGHAGPRHDIRRSVRNARIWRHFHRRCPDNLDVDAATFAKQQPETPDIRARDNRRRLLPPRGDRNIPERLRRAGIARVGYDRNVASRDCLHVQTRSNRPRRGWPARCPRHHRPPTLYGGPKNYR